METMNSYGDGNTYRGTVCKESQVPTIMTDGKTAYSGQDYPVHSSGRAITPNVHRKYGKEWALNTQLVGHEAWTLKTWESKPAEKTIADTKETIMRSFEFYHRHLQIPHFEMGVVDV